MARKAARFGASSVRASVGATYGLRCAPVMLALASDSDPSWAPRAIENLDRLLVDHAHCEMKAATNAMALSMRCLERTDMVLALTDLAEEELGHFRRVVRELERRGVPLAPPAEDHYAARLLRGANASLRDKSARGSVADRLLVGALIEARSCERFKLLSKALDARGESELGAFYEELFAAEAKHHMTFIELAVSIAGDAERVKARLGALATLEAEIVLSLPCDATIHG